jgi:FtsZ-binding cell division protein ZapB
MIELFRSPWRAHFQKALCQVRNELIIATPFIKKAEAEFVCKHLQTMETGDLLKVRVVTDLRAESVLGGALDMEALKTFVSLIRKLEIITLPHLHAKVYVFDNTLAVISSANLTSSGLDSNYEYGVGIRDPILVKCVKTDMDAYARVGNILLQKQIDELSEVAKEISVEYQNVQRSTTASVKKRFNEKLRNANFRFTEAMVAERSARALFSEAILYVLSKGSLPTRSLHPQIQMLLPELCDDSIELVIHGERFGKDWKHNVRNAQQGLKKRGLITFDGSVWSLSSTKN